MAVDAGMNVAEVEALGAALRKSADDLAAFASALDKLVRSAAWQGATATKFKQQWWPAHRSRMGQIETDLRGFGQSALNNANEQRDASNESSGGSSTVVSPVGGTPSLRDIIRLPMAEQVAVWNSLTREQQQALLKGKEASIGELGFIAPEIRYAANHQLVLEQYLALNDLDGKLNGLPEDLARRKDLYERLLRTHAQVLVFDPGGDGRIAVVEGDLAHAEHVAVTVPGIGNSMGTYWGMLDDSERLRRAAGTESTAVVAWLGYEAPAGLGENPFRVVGEATNTMLAQPASHDLVSFVSDIRSANPAADLTVIGHSYGSLVTGLAAQQGLDANKVVFIGSPGVGVSSVNDFHLPDGAQVFAAEATSGATYGGISVGGDGVSNLGHNVHPFGAVPTEPGFGATVIDLHDPRFDVFHSHSEYYKDGSSSLQNLGAIVSGSTGGGW